MPGKGVKRKNNFGDHSSSYWPKDWSFQRYLDAPQEEINTLSEEEQGKIRQGFYDVLGDDGISELADYVITYKQSKTTEATPSTTKAEAPRGVTEPGPELEDPAKEPKQTPAMDPNWLLHLQKRRRGQEWGFVIFRSACYDDGERWEDFKAKFQQIIGISFERDAEIDGVADAKANFRLRWIEDEGLTDADAEKLRAEYKKLRSGLPSGLSLDVFLWVTPEVVASVLDAADGDNLPTADSKWWRPSPPYALVVAASTELGLEADDPEREYFKPIFKAALETLVDELWWVLDSQIMPLMRIMRAVKAVGGGSKEQEEDLEDVWWSTAPSPARLRKRRRFA
jgi:hypothetical protein